MAVSRSSDRVGQVLGGRFRLLAPIGTGASASVYVAEDVVLRRRVAVKVLHDALADDEAFLRRFRAEAQAAAALNHPHLVAIYDWGQDAGDGAIGDGIPYLVTEYLAGGSLRGLLDTAGPLSPAQALLVGLEAARGLEYAHRRGFVHRDIKPANLLFDEDGRLRIADFGLARALAEAAWTEPLGAVLGTAKYASPEQARGESLDGKSDVYSLALVIVEAATGTVPFAADTTIGTLMARVQKPLVVPESLGALRQPLEWAGAPDPAQRPDAAELGAALMAAASAFDRPAPLALPRAPSDADLRAGLYDRTAIPGVPVPAPVEPPGLGLPDDTIVPGVGPAVPLATGVPAAAAAVDGSFLIAGPDWDPAHDRATAGDVDLPADGVDLDEVDPAATPTDELPAPRKRRRLGRLLPLTVGPDSLPPVAPTGADGEDGEDGEDVQDGDAAGEADGEGAVEAGESPRWGAARSVGAGTAFVAGGIAGADAGDADVTGVVAPAAWANDTTIVAGGATGHPPAAWASEPTIVAGGAAAGAAAGWGGVVVDPTRPAGATGVSPYDTVTASFPEVTARPPDPYGDDAYGRDPYGRDPHGRDPYGGDPYGDDGWDDRWDADGYRAPQTKREARAARRIAEAEAKADRLVYKAEQRELRPRRWPWVVSVLAVVLIGVGAFAGWWYLVRVPVHPMPAVVGKNVAELDRIIGPYEWVVAQELRYDDAAPSGQILAQQPPPNTEVARGSTITVTISKGLPPVDVPTTVVGKTRDEATQVLNAAGLGVGQVDARFDENVPNDVVLALAPNTPATVLKGTDIGLVVSKGPQPRTIPGDLVGAGGDDVVKGLQGMGLKVTTVEDFSDTQPAGKVIAVDPGAGAQVPKGGTVKVTVSKGPPTVAVPDVKGLSVEDATAKIEDSGLTVSGIEGSPKRKVQGTDPASGATVRKGSAVKLVTTDAKDPADEPPATTTTTAKPKP